jgi:2-oxoglutarate dehydrogenase E1 component
VPRFQPGKQQATGLRGLSAADRTLAKALDQIDSKTGSQKTVLDVDMMDHPTVHIRLSGQDCIRGTFNQRHAAIICQRTDRQYWQLNNMNVEEQASISVCNSSLSEAAILGFEYGYSLSNEVRAVGSLKYDYSIYQ